MKIVNVTPAGLPGALFIKRNVYHDARGAFSEVWREEDYAAAGITLRFVQDNVSHSVRGALRGLHAQRAPHEQGKLITVLLGAISDAIVDLRPNSPTYRRAAWFELRAEDARQLWIPPGFAHGFQCITDRAIVHYKCTAYHSAEHEIIVNPRDPALAIPWPIRPSLVSDKDVAAPPLDDHR